MSAPPLLGLGVDQGGDGRITAQLFQAAAPSRPDAPSRDAQSRADLGGRHRRVLDEQGDQLPGARGQVRKRLTQRGVTLRLEQLRLRDPCHLIRDVCGVQPMSGSLLFPRRAQDPAAFPLGGGSEPAGKRGRIAK